MTWCWWCNEIERVGCDEELEVREGLFSFSLSQWNEMNRGVDNMSIGLPFFCFNCEAQTQTSTKKN